MLSLRGTSPPPAQEVDLSPPRYPVPKTLPMKQQRPLRHQAARRTGWVLPAAILTEGIWAFFGSLVLGLRQRNHPPVIPQASWTWLAGAALISGLAGWLAWHTASPGI